MIDAWTLWYSGEMDRRVLLDLHDRELRIEIETPGVEKQTFPGLTRVIRPAPGMNFVLYSRLEPGKLDQAILDQIAFFQKFDQPFSWQVFDHDLPPELPERLAAHGFEPDDDPAAVLVLDLHASEFISAPLKRLEVRRLTDVEQLDDVVRVEEQVNGGDFRWLKQRMMPHFEIAGYLSVYVGYLEGRPVSTGWIYFHPGSQFAGLFGGATLAEFRGQGWYAAVLQRQNPGSD